MRLRLLAAFALAMIVSGSAFAQVGRTVEESRNAAAVVKAFDNWASGRGSVFDLLAPDMKWTIIGSTKSAGTYNRRQLDELILAPFNARMATPLKPVLHRIHSDGDTVIVLFDATGTRKDGKPYANSYTWYLTMKDDEIVVVTAMLNLAAYEDVLALLGPLSRKQTEVSIKGGDGLASNLS